MRHLAVAAESWDRMGRPDSEPYRGLRLSRAAEWRRTSQPELTGTESSFLDASTALASRERTALEEQARRDRVANRRLRVGRVVVVVLGLLAKDLDT